MVCVNNIKHKIHTLYFRLILLSVQESVLLLPHLSFFLNKLNRCLIPEKFVNSLCLEKGSSVGFPLMLISSLSAQMNLVVFL